MFNDFIGGGQVFLHKIRMLLQVLSKSFTTSMLVTITIMVVVSYKPAKRLDFTAFITYQKAYVVEAFDQIFSGVRKVVNPKVKEYVHYIDAYTQKGTYAKHIATYKILSNPLFKLANQQVIIFLKDCILIGFGILLGIFVLIYLVWVKFGKDVKAEKHKEGSNKVLTSKEASKILYRESKASNLYVGTLPLVKDSETKHFLITGSTGSGKTNLIHNILPQIEDQKHPVIVVDQTGEMIAKYYNPDRGDIIFNPFDERSKTWDLWLDCQQQRHLEKFADSLIGFSSRKANKSNTDFWEESAQTIFVACALVFQNKQDFSIEKLYNLICKSDNLEMRKFLRNTHAFKFFSKENARVAASITSVLMSNIKPLRFLKDESKAGKFSIIEYITNISNGSNSWLFLATEASTRDLTIPLNATLLELLISHLMVININNDKKLWFLIDELASLGKLPTLIKLMQEGRKYGACVIAGTQSISQLYHHYGNSDAANLIGLFRSKFIFGSDDPSMGDLYSKLCGGTTIINQQKNISFGANDFRDGISYNERYDKLPLVSYEDLTKLNTGECYILLPHPQTRLIKMQVPKAGIPDKNKWFVASDTATKDNILPNQDKNNKNNHSQLDFNTMELLKNPNKNNQKEIININPNVAKEEFEFDNS